MPPGAINRLPFSGEVFGHFSLRHVEPWQGAGGDSWVSGPQGPQPAASLVHYAGPVWGVCVGMVEQLCHFGPWLGPVRGAARVVGAAVVGDFPGVAHCGLWRRQPARGAPADSDPGRVVAQLAARLCLDHHRDGALRAHRQRVVGHHAAVLRHGVVDAESGVLCQADIDVATQATGVCPRVRFGNAGGVAWMVFQYILVVFYIGSNVIGIYSAGKLEIENEQKDTRVKEVSQSTLF